MSKQKHTDGPWATKKGNHQRCQIYGPDGQWVANSWVVDVRDDSRLPAEANADLIAAAPELLEACEAIARLADGQGQVNMMMVAGQARQAIAKARGE